MDKNTLLFMEGRTKALGDNIALGMKSFLGWKELTFKGLSILAQRLGNHLIQLNINKLTITDNISITNEYVIRVNFSKNFIYNLLQLNLHPTIRCNPQLITF